ncbi:autotransporter outer membrane beta-barrel domain-containing protein [Planctomicrobium piriforme]|uniref:Uncharacterized protein n=1 Tax=Planctomicrobium piriforme TaxID=1576369 RepID=A0A1I3KPS6_9PLAN|nr:hypothetical protein [Planctomicrobium piriforme]SFI74360.1 hypothetical protein SAMN05421753_1122 [Planctomicrobium piriforme]
MRRSTFQFRSKFWFTPPAGRRNLQVAATTLGQVQLLESRQLLSASPTVSNLGAPATYQMDFNPVPVAASATITDADGDFGGSQFQITMTNGASYDQLVIAGGNGVTGGSSEVFVDGISVGYASVGFGTTPFGIAFSASATASDVQRVLRQVSFVSYSNAPSITPRQLSIVATDGSGNASAPVAHTVNITDVPVLIGFGSSSNYRAGSAYAAVGTSIGINNAGGDYGNSKFVVTNLTRSGGDVLKIGGYGGVTVDGSNILLQGQVVATFSGGTGATPLTIQFGPHATFNTVRGVINNVAFSNTQTAPLRGPRTIGFIMTDGGGLKSQQVTTSLNVHHNLSISNTSPPPTYTPSKDYVFLAPQGLVSGAVNYLSGAKIGAYQTNARANDSVDLISRGSVTVDGDDVFVAGVHVGTIVRLFDSNKNANYGVTVTLDEGTTRYQAQEVLRSFAFKAYSRYPSLEDRKFNISIADNLNIPGGVTAQVVHINNTPVINPVNSPSEYFYHPAGQPVRIMSTAMVFDGGANYASSTLTVGVRYGKSGDTVALMLGGPISVIGTNLYVRTVLVGTYTPGNGSTPLQVQFNNNARENDVQTVLQRISYSTTNPNPSTATRNIAFQFTDGTGAVSEPVVVKVQYLT